MTLNDLCSGQDDPRQWARALANRGVSWHLEGSNVLAMARDAQRFDVLEEVMNLDVPGALAALRAVSEDAFVALHRAYLARYNLQDAPREVGTLFPLQMWADPGEVLQHAYTWISWVERNSSALRAFTPTPNNPALWEFDANAISEIGRRYRTIHVCETAEQAALEMIHDDPLAQQPHTAAAVEWISGQWGAYIATPPHATTGDIVREIPGDVVLVHLHHGGWTVHLDTLNERAKSGVVTVHPRPAATLGMPFQRVLGPFSFTPF